MENREIKFKAWIKSQNKLINVFGFNEHLVFEQNYDSPCINENIFEIEDCILLQFTGLKDKNGVDIYEGDFDQDYQVVKWCDRRNGWSMFIYDFPTKDFIACHCYNCEGNFEIEEIINEFVITGNIYENANFLENGK